MFVPVLARAECLLSNHCERAPVAGRRSPATAGGHHARIRFTSAKLLPPSCTSNWDETRTWGIRIRLQVQQPLRDLALFDLALDSKLRGCDLVDLKVSDIASGDRVRSRAMILQRKAGRPVQFEITEQTRRSVAAWISVKRLTGDEWLFPSRSKKGAHLSTRQYARLVDRWVGLLSLSGFEARAGEGKGDALRRLITPLAGNEVVRCRQRSALLMCRLLSRRYRRAICDLPLQRTIGGRLERHGLCFVTQ
jgi:hypothetical protein